MVGVAAPASATPADSLYSLVNQERAAKGLPALARNASIEAVAVNWANQMAASGTMQHNPNYSSQLPGGWTAVAENVAQGQPTAAEMNADWMNSPGHRANILGDFTSIGIAFITVNGTTWGVQNFAKYGTAAVAERHAATPVAEPARTPAQPPAQPSAAPSRRRPHRPAAKPSPRRSEADALAHAQSGTEARQVCQRLAHAIRVTESVLRRLHARTSPEPSYDLRGAPAAADVDHNPAPGGDPAGAGAERRDGVHRAGDTPGALGQTPRLTALHRRGAP